MQRQPEADRRRPGPAQDPALPAHGQGQDVGRRSSRCKEGGVDRGSARILYGSEDFS